MKVKRRLKSLSLKKDRNSKIMDQKRTKKNNSKISVNIRICKFMNGCKEQLENK